MEKKFVVTSKDNNGIRRYDKFYDWDSAYQKMLAILAEGHWAIAQDPSAAPKIIHYGERR
tara:strand:- start:408 stop:587 length:180 start_codon:yes stop_codon:yes gene_type:complete